MLTRSKFNQLIARSFSSCSSLQKKNLNKEEIHRAIKLLSSKNVSITAEEKDNYINYFTRALNSDIKSSDVVDNVSTNHFFQSLVGINSILKSTSTKMKLDPISTKEALAKCVKEEQVKEIFEQLLLSQDLNVTSLKYILMNRFVTDLEYFYQRLEFMKCDDLKLLVCSRSLMMKEFKLAKDIYGREINQWLQMRKGQQLSSLLEKCLYQCIWKISRDLDSLTQLKYTPHSYILLLEAIPRQFFNLSHIPLDTELTRNQELFTSFLSFLVSQPVSATSNKYIQQLMRLNVQNNLSKETDNEMTIHKYRYINGLSDLAEQMETDYTGVEKLMEQVHELDDVVLNETVLRFI